MGLSKVLGGVLFDTLSTDNYAYHYVEGVYQILDRQHILLFDGNHAIALYDYTIDPQLKRDLLSKRDDVRQRLERQLKGVLQRHHENMITNSLAN